MSEREGCAECLRLRREYEIHLRYLEILATEGDPIERQIRLLESLKTEHALALDALKQHEDRHLDR